MIAIWLSHKTRQRRDQALRRINPLSSSSARAREGGRLKIYLAACAAGATGFVLSGPWWGLLAGLATGLSLAWWRRHAEPPEVRAARLQAAADLPLAADLIAASLRAGSPIPRAVGATADAFDGEISVRLRRVSRAFELGAPPEEAWLYLGEIPGADRLANAAIRSSHSGARLANACTRVADELRAARMYAVERAAHRAGVLVAIPLGLCFLPAFLFAGVVPLVASVIQTVLK